jgi:hypothetical protein
VRLKLTLDTGELVELDDTVCITVGHFCQIIVPSLKLRQFEPSNEAVESLLGDLRK